GFRYTAVATAGVLLIAACWQVVGLQRAHSSVEVADGTHPGARALLTGAVDPAPLLPPPVNVTEDWVRIERWDCTPLAGFPMDRCTQPLSGPSEEPTDGLPAGEDGAEADGPVEGAAEEGGTAADHAADAAEE